MFIFFRWIQEPFATQPLRHDSGPICYFASSPDKFCESFFFFFFTFAWEFCIEKWRGFYGLRSSREIIFHRVQAVKWMDAK